MINLPREATAGSAVLALIGAWCIGYSVIDKFKGREYGGVTADGGVARTTEYDIWAKRNDRRTSWGLFFITIGGVLQIAAPYLPGPPSKEGEQRMSKQEPKQAPAGNAAPRSQAE